MFEQATSVPIDVMTSLIKAELGLRAPRRRRGRRHAARGLDPPTVVTLDLSAQSDAYDSAFTARRLAARRPRKRTRKGGSR